MVILGHNHLEKLGLNISCLHRTDTVMDCANATAIGTMGVFFRCVRGKSAVTGKMLVHRGMVFVIEEATVLLSQTTLKDLGVIPQTFPMIVEFGGIEQQGNGYDRFEVDSKYNVRYIAAESNQQNDDLQDEELGEPRHGPQQGGDLKGEEPVDDHDDGKDDVKSDAKGAEDVGGQEVPASVHTSQAAVRQTLGECPRRNIAEPPEQLPMTSTKSNIPALEAWIRDYFKDSTFNQCKRQQWPTTTGQPM